MARVAEIATNSGSGQGCPVWDLNTSREQIMPSLSSSAFWSMFDETNDKLGSYVGTSEDVTYYVKVGKDNKERVGELRWLRSTGVYTYMLLDEQQRDMVLHWYRVKPLEELHREVHTLVRVMRSLGKRVIELGCNLSSLHDAMAHLESAEASLRAGRHPVVVPIPVPAPVTSTPVSQKSAHACTLEPAENLSKNLRTEKSAHVRTPEQEAAYQEFIRATPMPTPRHLSRRTPRGR